MPQAETTAFKAALLSEGWTLSAPHEALFDAAILALKNAGIYAKLRTLSVPTGNTASAGVCIKGSIDIGSNLFTVAGGVQGANTLDAETVGDGEFNPDNFATGGFFRGMAVSGSRDLFGIEGGCKLFTYDWADDGNSRVKGNNIVTPRLGIGAPPTDGDLQMFDPQGWGFWTFCGTSNRCFVMRNGDVLHDFAAASAGTDLVQDADPFYMPAGTGTYMAAGFSADFLTVAEIRTLYTVLKTLIEGLGRTGFTEETDWYIGIDGDSLVFSPKQAGFEADTPLYEVIRNTVSGTTDNTKCVIVEYGVNGRQLKDFLNPATSYPNKTHSLALSSLADSRKKRIKILRFDYNDFAQGRGVLQFFGDVVTMCTEYREAGFYVIVCVGYSSATMSFNGPFYYNWLRSLFQKDKRFIDGTLAHWLLFQGDFLDMTIGGPHSYDGIHLKQAGIDIFGAALGAACIKVANGARQKIVLPSPRDRHPDRYARKGRRYGRWAARRKR